MAVEIKIGSQKWDVNYTSGGMHAAPTRQNYQNQAEIMYEFSEALERSETSQKVALFCTGACFLSGLFAIGSSYVDNQPCESTCIAWAVTSGLTGVIGIFCCCLGLCDN